MRPYTTFEEAMKVVRERNSGLFHEFNESVLREVRRDVPAPVNDRFPTPVDSPRRYLRCE